jgi:ATP sulfurylase
MNYCKRCDSYVEQCQHGDEDVLRISGSEGREMIMANKNPPEWFMHRSISQLILDEIKDGKRVFV